MKRITARLIASFAVVALGAGAVLTDAQAYGGHRGGHGGGHYHRGGGPGWGGVLLGTGLGFGLGYLSSQRVYGPPVYSYPPAYGWVEPAPVVVYRQPPVIYREAPVYREVPPVAEYREPVAPSRPEPIIYPRSGQGPEQTEADRQACNRWATTQRNAMADSGVFNRATEACMDARGYTLR